MRPHLVRVVPSAEPLPAPEQLAWRIAAVAADPVPVEAAVEAVIVDRLIDNAAVACASLNRAPAVAARNAALAHPHAGGATVFGLAPERRVFPEWAAWANGVAVRELDFHDTFLAAEFGHPGDTIPPLVAVAQRKRTRGAALVRAIATAYEVHVALMRSIDLHSHKIDHVAHVAVAVAAGLGALLDLPVPVVYQAIGGALHVSCSTRQSRKGTISSWKAFAPAHAGKSAIEAVDRAMRGESSPAPIYEGEESVIAVMLGGPAAQYTVWLPEPGEPKRAILDTFTKAYSAEYQAQALIDLAFRMRARVPDLDAIEEIVIASSSHTHAVIGSGSNHPQKYDPHASRETLDHSIMYIFAVALEDGRWHHLDSYAPERARRAAARGVWQKSRTVEDSEWSARYHDEDPERKAFGGRVEIVLRDGTRIVDELAVADAHPLGAKPFAHADYVTKFRALSDGLAEAAEQDRFIAAAEGVAALDETEMDALTVAVPEGRLAGLDRIDDGLF